MRFLPLSILFFIATNSVHAQTCAITAYGDTSLCGAAYIPLNATPGFDVYSWSPATGLSNPNIANPVANITASATYVLTARQRGPNLITNSDFSLGNTGFTSGHIYTTTYSPGNYYVGNSFFAGVYSFTDHTPTSDNMFMSVDGATFGTTLYETNVSGISAGTNYVFSFWSSRCHIGVPGWEVHFIGDVTGDQVIYVGAALSAPPASSTVLTWDQYVMPVWNSGANTSVTIRLINQRLDGYGNDFCLDDMEFYTMCVNRDTVTINVGNGIGLTNNLSKCAGESATLTVTGGSGYLWSTGATTPSIVVTPSTSTTYWVTGTSTSGCYDSLTVHVTVVPKPVVNITGTDSICKDAQATLTASGGSTYLWNNGLTTASINLSPASTTSYSVVVTNVNNCKDTAYHTVNVNPIPGPPLLSSDTVVCAGSFLPALQASGQNVVWNDAGQLTSIAPVPVTNVPGIYVYSATQTINGCESPSSSTAVKVIALPYISLPETIVLCEGDSATIGTTYDMAFVYSWGDGETNNFRPVYQAGVYSLTAVNSCGVSTDSCEIVVDPCECYFYLPNAFSPNGDGMNEEFKPVYDCRIDTYRFLIFDRWGNIVFETKNPGDSWNGQHNNQSVQQDVYVVLVQYTGLSGSRMVNKEYRGHVTVLR